MVKRKFRPVFNSLPLHYQTVDSDINVDIFVLKKHLKTQHFLKNNHATVWGKTFMYLLIILFKRIVAS